MTHKYLTSFAILASSGLLAVACSSDDKALGSYDATRAYLTQAVDCDDLLLMLKADAIVKLNASIDSDIAMAGEYGWGRGSDDTPPSAGVADNDSASLSDHDESSSDGKGNLPSTDGPTAGNTESASEYSETNTQVADVDEADIVKTDGRYIYLLHGREFLVLNAWPSTDLAQSLSFGIEGTPSEMYLTDDGKVVVYSTVDGTGVYAEAGIATRDLYQDPISDKVSDAVPPGYAYFANPLTKITVLQLQDTQPAVLSELYFEGNYSSSRRVGNYVRTVLDGASFGPNFDNWLPYWEYQNPSKLKAAFEQLRAEGIAKINNSTIEDWLPYFMIRTEDGVEAYFTACDEFYVPTVGSTNYGMTQIQSINLDEPESLPKGASIVGYTSVVYSNTDTLVLASSAWLDPRVLTDLYNNYSGTAGEGSSGGSGGASGWEVVDEQSPESSEGQGGAQAGGSEGWGMEENAFDDSIGRSSSSLNAQTISLSYTHLHAFDLVANPAQPQYVASGTVPGYVRNQFALDIHDGYLRVAVTDNVAILDKYLLQDTLNHVIVLGNDGGELVEMGAARDLAPGETVYSTRFIGERGYVVTFRQVDPLFVFDLSDPTAPTLLGELKIPGFSEYMHPLDSNHLLTIGQDDGLALQIFDVTDPVHPVQKHKYVYSSTDMYGYSEAQSNHKAFTYYASRGLLAFPFVGWEYSNYDYHMRSSLELFNIDTDKGISRRGSVDHTALFGDSTDPYGYCGGYYGVQVRRGVFLEDFVYSISYGGVVVNHIDDLSKPVATLVLDAPVDGSGNVCKDPYYVD